MSFMPSSVDNCEYTFFAPVATYSMPSPIFSPAERTTPATDCAENVSLSMLMLYPEPFTCFGQFFWEMMDKSKGLMLWLESLVRA